MSGEKRSEEHLNEKQIGIKRVKKRRQRSPTGLVSSVIRGTGGGGRRSADESNCDVSPSLLNGLPLVTCHRFLIDSWPVGPACSAMKECWVIKALSVFLCSAVKSI